MSWDVKYLILHYGEQPESLKVVTVSEHVTHRVARALQPNKKQNFWGVGSATAVLPHSQVVKRII